MDLAKIAQDEEKTYLQKVAAIVDEFAAGKVTGEEADAIAADAGISPEDLLDVYNAAYGDIEKTAADEAVESLLKIAEDADSTYLTKCAGIADAFAAGAITGEDADALAIEIGLAPSDVASVYNAAYGEDLEKEAGALIVRDVEKISPSVLDSVKKFLGGENFKKAKTYSDAYKHTNSKDYLAKSRKEAAKGAAKVVGATAVAGGTAKGAASLFGGKGEDK